MEGKNELKDPKEVQQRLRIILLEIYLSIHRNPKEGLQMLAMVSGYLVKIFQNYFEELIKETTAFLEEEYAQIEAFRKQIDSLKATQ